MQKTLLRQSVLFIAVLTLLTNSIPVLAQCDPPVSATVSSANSTCINNGSITVSNVTGGGSAEATIEYAITASSNPSQPLVKYQNSNIFNNIYPGTYTVGIRYNCGGTVTSPLTKSVTIGGNYVQLQASISNIRTAYCNNGGFTVTATGGFGARSYQLVSSLNADQPDPSAPAAAQSANVFDNLAPGRYYVRIMDACGNFITRQVDIPSATASGPFRTTFQCSASGSAFGKIDSLCGSVTRYTLKRRSFISSPAATNMSLPGQLITHYPDGTSDVINITSTTQFGSPAFVPDKDITSMINAGQLGSYYLEFIDNCGTVFTSLKAAYKAPENEQLHINASVGQSCAGPTIGYNQTLANRFFSNQTCHTECPVAPVEAGGAFTMEPLITYYTDDFNYSLDNGATWHNQSEVLTVPCSTAVARYTPRFQYCGNTDTQNTCQATFVPACDNSFPATEMNNFACNGNTGMYIKWKNAPVIGETVTLEFTSVPEGQPAIPVTTTSYTTDLGKDNGNQYVSQISDLLPGTYSYKVTNACGQEYTNTITLSRPHQFAIENVTTEASCNNADLTVSLSNAPFMSATSTSTAYQERNIFKVELVNSAGRVVQTTQVTLGNTNSPLPYSDNGGRVEGAVKFAGVQEGEYTLRFSHNFYRNLHKIPASCPVTRSVVVPKITMDITPSLFRDCGDGNGAISVIVLGGVAPFNYKLYAGSTAEGTPLATQTDPLFSGLNPDQSYAILATDQCGSGISASKSFSTIAPAHVRHIGNACDGEKFQLYVNKVDGASYVWEKNGVVLENTTSILDFPSFSAADYGDYKATVNVPGCGGYTDNQVLDAGSCNNLPVVLTDFDAKEENGTVLLSWTTASEVNNLGFELERSSDGKRFFRIGFVAAKPGNGTREYQFTDLEPESAKQYYRLRQIDRDGTFAYSSIVYVSVPKMPFVALPNPAIDFVKIKALPAGSRVEIFDVSGRLVKTVITEVGDEQIDIQSFASGTYLLRVSGKQMQQSNLKIVKP
ncbi:T9SS type A sorting domain-containing protein [Dyadobacter aurulentus]|uniref:T9SS type A sorting domain-containing protein n=1 Tax=Dyadobacter sp. UC 10 TaxID=2605428 RepID=UPI001788D134|nr:T9SS type A sorting domain-containing protein [Dyadobacter sp. UC 10]